MLKNGLMGLTGKIEYENLETILKLGSRLEVSNVNFDQNERHKRFTFYAKPLMTLMTRNDVEQMVSNLRRLRILRADVTMDALQLLKDIVTLEELRFTQIGWQDGELFKESVAPFGHQRKSLVIDDLQQNSLIKFIVDACPNLET